MRLNEMLDKVLNPLNSLKDDTNDALNTTPYILRRLSEFTDGELDDLISELEYIQGKAEELEDANEKLQETVQELQDAVDAKTENDPLERVISGAKI